jgi:hypothetical protein
VSAPWLLEAAAMNSIVFMAAAPVRQQTNTVGLLLFGLGMLGAAPPDALLFGWGGK